MNKCNFCEYSIPNGNMGGWICPFIDSAKYYHLRVDYCNDALKTMKKYNETRAGNFNNSKER